MLIAKILLVAFSFLLQQKLFPENIPAQAIELTSYSLPQVNPERVLAQRAMVQSGLCRSKLHHSASDSLPAWATETVTPVDSQANLATLCF